MYPNRRSEHGVTCGVAPRVSSIDNAGALPIGAQIAETAQNSRFVQESVAGVAYGLGWLLALDNTWAVSCLTGKNSLETPMPMIDVYAPADLFPVCSDRQLAEQLTSALLRAEGVTAPTTVHLANTAAYIHRLDPKAVHTASTDLLVSCASKS